MAEEQRPQEEDLEAIAAPKEDVTLHFFDDGEFEIHGDLRSIYDAATVEQRIRMEKYAVGMRAKGWRQFRFGTCHGLFRHKPKWFEIMAVDNQVKGNLHYGYLLDHLEVTARKSGQGLRIYDMNNPKLRDFLLDAGWRMEEWNIIVKQQHG